MFVLLGWIVRFVVIGSYNYNPIVWKYSTVRLLMNNEIMTVRYISITCGVVFVLTISDILLCVVSELDEHTIIQNKVTISY